MVNLAVVVAITVGDALLEYREIVYILALAFVYRLTGKTRSDLWDGVLTTGASIASAEKGIRKEIQNGVHDELTELRTGMGTINTRLDTLSGHVDSLAKQVSGGQ